jgi:hypothetical protein
MGVVCAADPSLLPLVFKAYDEDRVFDIQIALLLHLIARGCVSEFNGATTLLDPETYKPLYRANGSRAVRVSLDLACKVLLGREDAKKNDYWRCRYALLENTPLEQWPTEAIQYPKDDAKNTYDCAVALMSGRYENQHDQSNQARAAFALQLSAIWGLRTDKAANDAIEEQYKKLLKTHVDKFFPFGLLDQDGKINQTELKKAVVQVYKPDAQKCGVCFGTGKVKSDKSNKQIGCVKCDTTGLNIEGVPQTKGEGVAKDGDTLEESGDSLLMSFAEVTNTKKILDTYLPMVRKGEQYAITTSPNVLLNTGRSSYGGLVQTLPKKGGIRECFVAREGKVFCSVDYSGVELATLAQCLLWICKKSKMADALNADYDLHSSFASQMLGISYDDYTKRLKAGDETCKAYRQAAKAANFGFPGGMSAPTLVVTQRKVGIKFCEILEGATCGVEKTVLRNGSKACTRCITIAKRLRFDWLNAFPEMEEYFDFHKRNQTGKVEQFVSKRIRGGLEYCAACNTLFQGLAADGAKKALYRITRECYVDKSSPLFGSRMLIFIHDETFMEHDERTAHEAGFRQAKIMIDSMREYTPDVLIKAEPALCKRWYKDAKTVYDKEGRLTIWQP